MHVLRNFFNKMQLLAAPAEGMCFVAHPFERRAIE